MRRTHEPIEWERVTGRAGMKPRAGCGGDIVQDGPYREPRETLAVKCARCGARWSRPDARFRFRREGEKQT